jgi:hypothetical protein
MSDIGTISIDKNFEVFDGIVNKGKKHGNG